MLPNRPNVQLDAVELWVGDFDRTNRTLIQFGFAPDTVFPASRPGEKTACLSTGDVRFLVMELADGPTLEDRGSAPVHGRWKRRSPSHRRSRSGTTPVEWLKAGFEPAISRPLLS